MGDEHFKTKISLKIAAFEIASGCVGLIGTLKLRLSKGKKALKLILMCDILNSHFTKQNELKNSFRFSKFLNIDDNTSNNSPNNTPPSDHEDK